MNLEILKRELTIDEGRKLRPYRCSAGYPTIGIGHNMEANPLPSDMAAYLKANGHITDDMVSALFASDINFIVENIRYQLPWFDRLDDVRQRVIVNMGFNLGMRGLLGFKNTLEAIRTGRYAAAADGMLASKWAKQVGKRAVRLAAMMETGRA